MSTLNAALADYTEAEPFVETLGGIDLCSAELQGNLSRPRLLNKLPYKERTDAVILPCARHVDLIEVDGIGSPTDCKPAGTLIVHRDNGGISCVVPFGESLPLEVVAAPAEKLLDNRSLGLKIEGLYEAPVIQCGRSKCYIHRAVLEYLTVKGRVNSRALLKVYTKGLRSHRTAPRLRVTALIYRYVVPFRMLMGFPPAG